MMKAGDTLIYGDGERVLIEGFPKINGQPGVLVKPNEKPLSASDILHLQSEVKLRVAQGVWQIESAGERKET